VFARATLLEIDTLRVSVDDAAAAFEDGVLPRLRAQPGFCGCYALAPPEGRAMLITFWETAEQAATDEAGWYPSVLAEFTTLFRSPPGRDRYEVRVAVPPELAASDR
jgi:hypothetical protein